MCGEEGSIRKLTVFGPKGFRRQLHFAAFLIASCGMGRGKHQKKKQEHSSQDGRRIKDKLEQGVSQGQVERRGGAEALPVLAARQLKMAVLPGVNSKVLISQPQSESYTCRRDGTHFCHQRPYPPPNSGDEWGPVCIGPNKT